ncbi:MAG TPA: response regulator transcription factor [Candidatus Obscuribacterales bacterium]
MEQPPANPVHLLLIDDDIKFCRLIADYLKRFGYEVTAVHSGPEGLARAVADDWEAVIIDVMLPGMDGFEVLRKLREQRDIPALMLTSLGEETDRIIGLEMGADDYLPKTSSPRELLARLRAVLRRFARAGGEAPDKATQQIVVGALKINTGARVATVDGEELQLTPVEFELLVVLAQSRNRVKSREELINEIRDRNYDVYDRSIDVHVSALRRKLKDDPKNPRFIRTVRAAGYMLLNAEN